MSYMSWHEITTAARWWRTHPVLGPASATLKALRDASGSLPEHWAYFGAPAKAGSALAELIQGNDNARYDRPDATPDAPHAALQPVIAFRSARNLDFPVTETMRAEPGTAPPATDRAADDDAITSRPGVTAQPATIAGGPAAHRTPGAADQVSPTRAQEVD